jgi:hypothetical protein
MRQRGTSGPLNAGPLVTLLNLIDGEPWTSQAACAGRDGWFPDRHGDGLRDAQVARAAAVCNDCPVWRECGEEALARGEQWGIWAGVYFEGGHVRVARARLEEKLGRTA